MLLTLTYIDPLEVAEEQCLLDKQEESPALNTELEHDQNSNWLRGSGWAQWFGGKPLILIVMAPCQPQPLGCAMGGGHPLGGPHP